MFARRGLSLGNLKNGSAGVPLSQWQAAKPRTSHQVQGGFLVLAIAKYSTSQPNAANGPFQQYSHNPSK